MSRTTGGKRSVESYRRAGYKAWQTRQERAERVAVNVAPEHLALWERVGESIRGETAHERFEAFQEYVEEHPGEAMAALQDHADARLEALLAERDAADAAA